MLNKSFASKVKIHSTNKPKLVIWCLLHLELRCPILYYLNCQKEYYNLKPVHDTYNKDCRKLGTIQTIGINPQKTSNELLYHKRFKLVIRLNQKTKQWIILNVYNEITKTKKIESNRRGLLFLDNIKFKLIRGGRHRQRWKTTTKDWEDKDGQEQIKHSQKFLSYSSVVIMNWTFNSQRKPKINLIIVADSNREEVRRQTRRSTLCVCWSTRSSILIT